MKQFLKKLIIFSILSIIEIWDITWRILLVLLCLVFVIVPLFLINYYFIRNFENAMACALKGLAIGCCMSIFMFIIVTFINSIKDTWIKANIITKKEKYD